MEFRLIVLGFFVFLKYLFFDLKFIFIFSFLFILLIYGIVIMFNLFRVFCFIVFLVSCDLVFEMRWFLIGFCNFIEVVELILF